MLDIKLKSELCYFPAFSWNFEFPLTMAYACQTSPLLQKGSQIYAGQVKEQFQNTKMATKNIYFQPIKIVSPKQTNQDIQELEVKSKEKTVKRSETKNILKNFGKAIVSMVYNNLTFFQPVFKKYKINSTKFIMELRGRRHQLSTITSLKTLWLEESFQYAGAFREICYYFMRKRSFKHIFNSRIVDRASHLKYRKGVLEALQNPRKFCSIKGNS